MRLKKLSLRRYDLLRHLTNMFVWGLVVLSVLSWWQRIQASMQVTMPAATGSPVSVQPELNSVDVLRALAGTQGQPQEHVAAVEDEAWNLFGVLAQKRGTHAALLSLNGARPVVVKRGDRLGETRWRLEAVESASVLLADVSDPSSTRVLALPPPIAVAREPVPMNEALMRMPQTMEMSVTPQLNQEMNQALSPTSITP